MCAAACTLPLAQPGRFASCCEILQKMLCNAPVHKLHAAVFTGPSPAFRSPCSIEQRSHTAGWHRCGRGVGGQTEQQRRQLSDCFSGCGYLVLAHVRAGRRPHRTAAPYHADVTSQQSQQADKSRCVGVMIEEPLVCMRLQPKPETFPPGQQHFTLNLT